MSHPVDHIKQYLDITPEMEDSLRAMMTEKSFRRGQSIMLPQKLQVAPPYIRKGSARSFYLHGGRDHTYSFAFDDEFISIPMSRLQDAEATVGIEFLEPTDAIFMPIHDLRSLFKDYEREHAAEIASYLMSNLLDHTREIETRLLALQSMSAIERYQWFIQRYPDVTGRATITQIASFLGVTKETLYRIRAGRYSGTGQKTTTK